MPATPRSHAILYYSRDGHTDRLARQLSSRLDADLFRIAAASYGGSWWGYVVGGFDSLTGRLPAIEPVKDLSGYASLSLGAPVWTTYLAAPLRAYLARSPALPKAVGLFLTCGEASFPTKAIDMAGALCRRPLVATLCVPNGIDGTPEMEKRISAYVAPMLRLCCAYVAAMRAAVVQA